MLDFSDHSEVFFMFNLLLQAQVTGSWGLTPFSLSNVSLGLANISCILTVLFCPELHLELSMLFFLIVGINWHFLVNWHFSSNYIRLKSCALTTKFCVLIHSYIPHSLMLDVFVSFPCSFHLDYKHWQRQAGSCR